MKRNFFNSFVVLVASGFLFSIIVGFNRFEKKPWPVPDEYKKMKNPIVSNEASIEQGKTLYTSLCKSCHGTKGLGDGQRAIQLNTEPGDFSKDDFQSQSDGSLFYKTTEGRDEMPGFKTKIPTDDERWSIVNYMRTFKK